MHYPVSAIANRMSRLAANPHNIGGIAGAPPLTNHAYWAARFEREGHKARLGAECPYNPGTMAATRWQAGADYRHGERLYSQGFPCPDSGAAREGWNDTRGYYLSSLERGARP